MFAQGFEQVSYLQKKRSLAALVRFTQSLKATVSVEVGFSTRHQGVGLSAC